MNPQPLPRGLQLFSPPYHRCDPVDLSWIPDDSEPGVAAVWFMSPESLLYRELEWLWERPRSLPLFIVLPEPEEIPLLVSVLRMVPDLNPRGVLPALTSGTMRALRTLLASPPRVLAPAVADLLTHLGYVPDQETRERIETIFSRAAHTPSIDQLCTALCQSRRTLGRFFAERDLPVPSHWLQFARILHVSIQIQNTRANISRISMRFGYTDGFTMSNSMKRLTGVRPSFVREHLGWEWIVTAWLRLEKDR